MSGDVLDLRGRASWSPLRLAAEQFRWPNAAASQIVSLSELGSTVVATAWADEGAPVLTPEGTDAVTGRLRRRSRRYSGSAFQIGAVSDLAPGDLLIPSASNAPALIANRDMVGSLVSPRFTALRTDPQLTLWLWAVLNSATGRRYRSIVGTRTPGWPATAGRRVLEFAVPVPPLATLAALHDQLADAEADTQRDGEDPPDSWWRIADLRATDWHLALATPDPDALNRGKPLAEMCDKIVLGSFDPRSGTQRAGEAKVDPATLPVTDIRVLNGGAPRAFASDNATKVALPGDVLVAQHGERAYATVVLAPTIPARHVYALRLADPALGPALVRYLNSQDGLGVRRILATGMTIPTLSRRALERLPVPTQAFDDAPDLPPDVPLAQRLERLLWR